MSERKGYIKIWRKAKNNWLWTRTPYDPFHAWVYLIEAAAWKKHQVHYQNRFFELERKQLVRSLRQLAMDWGWSVGRVGRFLKTLKTATMIDTTTEQGILKITVLNYGRYQDTPNEAEQPQPQPRDKGGTEAEQRRNTDGTRENKGLNKGQIKENEGEKATPPPKDSDGTTEQMLMARMRECGIIGTPNVKRDHIHGWRMRYEAGEIEAAIMNPENHGIDIYELHKRCFRDTNNVGQKGFQRDVACPRCQRKGVIKQVIGGRYEETVNCPDCGGTGYKSPVTA